MAEDNQDRTREKKAEREAEIESEMERVDQDPDQIEEGSENLGTQSVDSGAPDEDEEEEDPIEAEAEAEEPPGEVRGDEEPAEKALRPDDDDEE